jgi:ribosomal protein S18 acetylase RimI-like enzyme
MDRPIKEYDELLTSVEFIMEKLSYDIQITHLDHEEPTVIFIMYKEYRNNRIGSLVIRIREDMLKTGRVTRNTQEQLHNTFYISDINISESYQGKGVGSLLLIYGMCYSKINNPNIVYVTLDDGSKYRKHMRSNIYGKL